MSAEHDTRVRARRIEDCASGLSAATLSAWRDGALTAAEADAIARHITGCAACRVRLDRYATIAEGLRSIATPAPSGGYGQNPRLSETSIPPIGSRLPRLEWLPWRGWPARVGWVGAAAAVLLLVVALTQWLRSPGQPPLVWQVQAPLPGNISLTAPTGDVALAPGDGDTGFACAPSGAPGGTVIRVWRTRDRAATWFPIFTTPAAADGAACLLAVDASNAATAVLSVVPSAVSTTLSASFVTRDGGATWHALPGGPVIRQLASVRGVVYALRQAPDGQVHLVVSHDNLATWTLVDQAITRASAPQRFQVFWLDPASGALLVATADLPSGDARLWSSADGGQHWTELNAATQAGGFVARPAGGSGWHICAASYDPTRPAAPNALECSDDGGRTWAARPALNVSTVDGHAAAIPRATVFALTSDGSLLALAPTGTDAHPMLYRLAGGAGQWRAQGALPEPVVYYAAAPGSGVLWALPGATAFDPRQRIFTASSP